MSALGVLLRQLDELPAVAGRDRAVHEHELDEIDELSHRCELPYRVLRHLLERERVRRVRGIRCHQKRVAVGRRIGDELRADDRAAAGFVLDDDWLAPAWRQSIDEGARHDVDAAAGGRGHDDFFAGWLGNACAVAGDAAATAIPDASGPISAAGREMLLLSGSLSVSN